MDSDISVTIRAEDVVQEVNNFAPTTANQRTGKNLTNARGRGKSTRNTISNRDDRDSSRAVTPAKDVSQEASATQPATTKAGKPRVRMKWNEDMNLFIMRTYYYITKLETDKTMHCKKLHDEFILKYPELNVTAQRIGDQRRAIIRNKLLSDEVISDIKKEIAERLKREERENSTTDSTNSSSDIPNSQTNLPQPSNDTTNTISYLISSQTSSVALSPIRQDTFTQLSDTPQLSHTSTQTNDQCILSARQQLRQAPIPEAVNIDALTQKLIEQLDTALTHFNGTEPTARPKLPRLKENKKLYEYVGIFNKNILGRYFSIDSDINIIHTLIYCSALVVSENLGYNIKYTTNQHGKRQKT